MKIGISKFAAIVSLVFIVVCSAARGSIVWTYDFPGSPGSGLAADQTNPQPGGATFGDWTRVNLTAGTANDAFESTFWNNTAVFDPTQYESFTITAVAGYHLNLNLLTFAETRDSGGPTKGRIEMFVDGSTSPYDVFNYLPTAQWKNLTFNFQDANNVTSVEFRFYGWNGGTPDAGLLLDNVAITLSVVPETPTFWPALLLICVVTLQERCRHLLQRMRPVIRSKS